MIQDIFFYAIMIFFSTYAIKVIMHYYLLSFKKNSEFFPGTDDPKSLLGRSNIAQSIKLMIAGNLLPIDKSKYDIEFERRIKSINKILLACYFEIVLLIILYIIMINFR